MEIKQRKCDRCGKMIVETHGGKFLESSGIGYVKVHFQKYDADGECDDRDQIGYDVCDYCLEMLKKVLNNLKK